MLLLSGQLHVTSVQRKGKLTKKGLLASRVGKFVIHDERLYGLPEGSHTGIFEIEQIAHWPATEEGRFFVENSGETQNHCP